MGSKPKTRFVVSTEHKLRELFSVRESQDGSLVIIRTDYEGVADQDEIEHELAENHFTVHPSDRSGGTTIKHTIRTKAGKLIEDMLYVADSADQLFMLVYSSRQGFFPDHQVSSPRSKDRVLQLATYDQWSTTLYYSVWVCDLRRDPPPPPPGVFRLLINFRRFALAVYSTYSPVRAYLVGCTHWLTTSTQRINRGPTENLFSDSPSIPFEEFWETMWDHFELGREDLLRRLPPEFEARGIDPRSIKTWRRESGRWGLFLWTRQEKEP